jgi:3-hydroxyacyl-CoA dehydrogenase
MKTTHTPFKTAAVLGAGVMGSQIAAHLANAGLSVLLLDIPSEGENKNAVVEKLWASAAKFKPSPFFSAEIPHRITLGNFEDDLHRLSEVDWVIEAVVENLSIKQQLMKRLESSVGKETVVSTNTSGLPLHRIVEECSESFCRRFLGTHFFNPPRYMKLLELIPEKRTDPQVLERIKWFGRVHLGKGIVVGKGTPNFIGNRIGIHDLIPSCLHAVTKQDYTIEEVDFLTGTLVGRPKSGTFFTIDLIGIDTLIHILDWMYEACTTDECRQTFRTPELLRQLQKMGRLGMKSGGGFYKKDGKQILVINPETLEYEPSKPVDLGEKVKEISRISNVRERIRELYQEQGRAGNFFRETIQEILIYAARRLPEITDNPANIDQAIRWGYNWELGLFEIWDLLGLERISRDFRAKGVFLPAWLEGMLASGAKSFYKKFEPVSIPGVAHGYIALEQPKVYIPGKGYLPLETSEDEISLETLKMNPKHTLRESSESALLDLGNGVALYEFRSHGNALSLEVIKGLFDAIDLIEEKDKFLGLVIGNEGKNFCTGANLRENMAVVQVELQKLLQRVRYSTKPIVAALHGKVLGGGCELAQACVQVVAATETSIGLVELAVGLIPGAGGLTRMVIWAIKEAATETADDIMSFLRKAFWQIITTRVSGSALEAQNMGYLSDNARIAIDAERRLYVAKEEVIRLSNEAFLPPPVNNSIIVLGSDARTKLEQDAYQLHLDGKLTEYDYYLAQQVAFVMTGGDVADMTRVDENYLLKLETEVFASLLNQEKTQERIASLFTNKKPVRN